jgi:hypothetical protein
MNLSITFGPPDLVHDYAAKALNDISHIISLLKGKDASGTTHLSYAMGADFIENCSKTNTHQY